MNVGSRLRAARKGAQLTQRELAAQINCARETLANYESGRYPVSLENLEAVARVTGRPPKWFLEEDEEGDEAAAPASEGKPSPAPRSSRRKGRARPAPPKARAEPSGDLASVVVTQAPSELSMTLLEQIVAMQLQLAGAQQQLAGTQQQMIQAHTHLADTVGPTLERLTTAVEELKKESLTTRLCYEDLVRQLRAGGISNGSYFRSGQASSPVEARAEEAK